MSIHPKFRQLLWMAAILSPLVLSLVLAFTARAASDAPKAIYLPLVSTPKETTAISGISSDALIEEARQAGALDNETALLYRVYASFDDPRLPAQYRGDDNLIPTNTALREAQARFDTLSAQTRAALAPFFLPPSAETSWHEVREAGAQRVTLSEVAANSTPAESNAKIKWITTCQADPNIKVWYQERYPEDAAAARQVCDEVSGVIWPRLVSLMGRTPMDDGSEANNGGDAQFDFYLVNARTGPVGYRGCDNTPSYINVHRTRWNNALLASAVMGALVDSYPSADCMEYMWLYDATRTWSIDHVYPQDQWEHHYADDYLLHSDSPLDSYPIVPLGPQNEVGMGAYLWVWYAANMLKTPAETVPLWWQGAMNPDSLAAVNSVMGEAGFENKWKSFAGLNWNEEPVDIYKELDSMPHRTKLMMDEVVTLDGNQDRSYELDGNVRYLSSHTFRFTFMQQDLRSVLFINPFQDGAWPTADVTAYYKLQDQSWHIEEWTTQHGKGFCRDLIAERVEELVIVISNDEWKDTSHKLQPAKPPRLNVTNVGCRGWEFEGTATWKGTGEEYSIDDSATVKATFMRLPYGDASGASSLDYYQVTEGSGTWTHTGHHVNCGGSGGGDFAVTGGNSSGLFILSKATDHATSTEYVSGDRRYNGFAGEALQFSKLSVTWICKSGEPHQTPSSSAMQWFLTNPLFEQDEMVSADGTLIQGNHERIDDDGMNVDVYTWEWTMKALPPE